MLASGAGWTLVNDKPEGTRSQSGPGLSPAASHRRRQASLRHAHLDEQRSRVFGALDHRHN